MAEVRAASILHGLGFDKDMQVGVPPVPLPALCPHGLVARLRA
jgi:hypothetical protein